MTQEALRPYVPETLIRLLEGRREQEPAWHAWLDGALMHCDITGFTAMSESLAGLGREGAELMASVLNSFFETMLTIAGGWGGVQMKFGGDAMLLHFDGDGPAARAAACGLEMQRRMRAFRRVAVAGTTYELRMRIGLHAGRFFCASVGGGDGPLQYVLLGRDVNAAAAIEAAGVPGQVVATDAAREAIGATGRLTQGQRGTWRVRSIVAARPARAARGNGHANAGLLRRYVLAPIAEAAGAAPEGNVGGRGPLSSEQRRVTAMFVNLLGSSELLERAGADETLRQVDAYARALIAAVERHGGVVLGSDVADHGDKFIVLFGAPLLAEEQEASALRCAVDVSAALAAADLELEHQIGVNSGPVFAGEIGSRERREYTVIGDAVNLAARLMAHARPGETLVSAATADRAGPGFELRKRRPIRVKGKTAPVRLFELCGARAAELAGSPDATRFCGRARELGTLERAARRLRRDRAGWCLVSGEAGIGKTRLMREAEGGLAAAGWRVLRGSGRAHTAGVPFGLWGEPLRALLDVGDGTETDGAAAVRDAVSRLAPAHAGFAGLLCELLGLPADGHDLAGSLDAKARRERLTAMVAAALAAAAQSAPIVLVMDDAQWSDTASLELLGEVLRRARAPILACVANRDGSTPAPLEGVAPEASVALGGLDERTSSELAGQFVDDEDARRAIVARAHGNPLFIVELARAPAGAAMPESVNDVILARLDALPRADREALRYASVIGQSFEPDMLSDVAASVVVDAASACARLAASGLLLREGASFSFAHGLTREVAYETLLYADRRRLHDAIGKEMERRGGEDTMPEVLLHHFREAQAWGRVARYGLMAGDRAAGIFATSEAVGFYRAALDGLDEGHDTAGAATRVDRSILLEHMGDALDMAGRHREAGDAYFTALSEWLTRGESQRARYVRAGGVRARIRRAVRESEVCRKISVSYERRSDYEQALSWIEQALARLPDDAVSTGAEVMASKSVTLFRRGQYAEAIEWGERAVALSRRARDRRVSAYAHNMLANSYIEQGALKQAVRHLESSLASYVATGDLRGQSAAGNNLGSCHQLLGHLDDALSRYQEALAADVRLGNAAHAAIIHNNIGEVLLALGRIGEAREHLRDVLRTYQSGAGLAALAGLAEVNLSRCALAEGDAGAGEAHARRGIRLLREVGAQGLLDEAELQLAEVRLAQGRTDAALRRCRVTLARARASGARLIEARAARLLGAALARRGDAAGARRELEASIGLAREIDAGMEEARAIIELVALGGADAGERRRLLRRAQRVAGAAGLAPELARIEQLGA